MHEVPAASRPPCALLDRFPSLPSNDNVYLHSIWQTSPRTAICYIASTLTHRSRQPQFVDACTNGPYDHARCGSGKHGERRTRRFAAGRISRRWLPLICVLTKRPPLTASCQVKAEDSLPARPLPPTRSRRTPTALRHGDPRRCIRG